MNQTLDSPPESASAAPDDPRVIQAVEEYLAALEAGTPLDRSQFLAERGDIADVLAECLDTLQFVHQVGPRLQRPDEATLPHPALMEESPTPAPLGDFQIIREIGRGGMGVVYEARQLSLGRRVALKVLPFASAIDPKHLQRFKNEAQAAAQLHHPGIVQVYAVGCERGVHYYAMEYIEGQSLAALIQELRQLPRADGRPSAEGRQKSAEIELLSSGAGARTTAPVAALDTVRWGERPQFFRWVAQLGLKAAQALEHAHQLAVVHRDIKPANLLLDVRGELWITDFGLALFPNQPGLTVTGEVLGTLRNMSPEQALGQRGLVDHRTDIYSLGATLYELVTLQPVVDGQDRQELLGRLASEEPRPPREIEPALPVDLETIVLKTLAKNPAERYASAHELAQDLQSFLEDRPIRARRPTLLEKAAKWARRHRMVMAAAVAIVFLSMAGLITSTVLIAHEQAETQAALGRERIQAAKAHEQRLRAEESFRQARQAVEFLTQISEDELANLPHAQGVRRKLLETAIVYFQDFIEKHQDDPSIQAELAAGQARVSRILAELSVLQGSGQFLILTNRVVQDDLKLKEGQRQQIARLADKMSEQWREAFGAFRQLSQEERRTKSLELARASEKPVAELLSPEQAKRFKQIVLQVQQRGPYGFSDPELVQALGLTAKQKDKIRVLLQDGFAPPWENWPPEGKKGPKKGASSWRGVLDKVLAVLTPEQRETWNELTGPPLTGDVYFIVPGASDPRFAAGRFGPGPPGGFNQRWK